MNIYVIAPTIMLSLLLASPCSAAKVTPQAINEARFGDNSTTNAFSAKTQILLDRARFSPGVIDGQKGENVRNALRAFRAAKGLTTNGEDLDAQTWEVLVRDAPKNILIERLLTEADVKGPFTSRIPDRLEEQRDLPRLGYRNRAEKLAEQFHMGQHFFEALNAGKTLEPGSKIWVPNLAKERAIESVSKIEIAKDIKQLRVFDKNGKLLAAFPVTVGSDERPAPSGTLTIESVAENPPYTVKPSNNLKGVDSAEAFEIAPGPNNPVGVVWIALSKDSYGIHGTPEPAQIGKTTSHGCIRLTNWDAKTLASSVSAGTPVHFVKTPNSVSD